MTRKKAGAQRPLIGQQKDILPEWEAMQQSYSTAELVNIIGISRNDINRLVKDKAITPSVSGEGAGVARKFSFWNVVLLRMAKALLDIFRYEIVVQLLMKFDVFMIRRFPLYTQTDHMYRFLFNWQERDVVGNILNPFHWPATSIFGIKLIEMPLGDVFIPMIIEYDPERPSYEAIHGLFRDEITYFINLRKITREAGNQIKSYDMMRAEKTK